ncbi:hypothetical protein SCHPADRAFT_990220, partial [Schizopora paradoxa]
MKFLLTFPKLPHLLLVDIPSWPSTDDGIYRERASEPVAYTASAQTMSPPTCFVDRCLMSTVCFESGRHGLSIERFRSHSSRPNLLTYRSVTSSPLLTLTVYFESARAVLRDHKIQHPNKLTVYIESSRAALSNVRPSLTLGVYFESWRAALSKLARRPIPTIMGHIESSRPGLSIEYAVSKPSLRTVILAGTLRNGLLSLASRRRCIVEFKL